jgi:hypothetical protein
VRSAVDGFAAEGAEGEGDSVGAADGRIVTIEVDVSGDEEIEASITVVITPGCTRGPVAERHACLLSNICEGAVMVVVIEAILAVVGHENIRPAIIVVVGHSDAETPSIIGDARLGGYVGERAVVVVVKEGSVGRFFFAIQGLERGTIGEVDIEPAIVVVVDQAHPGSIRFQDELLVRVPHVMGPVRDAGLFGDVLEDDRATGDESSRSDGALVSIVLGWMGRSGGGPAAGRGLGSFGGLIGSSLAAGAGPHAAALSGEC